MAKSEIDRLVEDNIGIAYAAIHKYFLSNEPEAESIALNALYMAATTYDPNNASKAKFSSYAYVCVQNRLGDLIRKMKNKTSTMVVFMSDLTGGLAEATMKSQVEAEIFVSEENIQLDYEKREECRYVILKLTEIIENTKPGTRKTILTKWFYTYNCNCKIVELAAECNCVSSYVRKVLLETRVTLNKILKEWKEC